jgi:iron complex transport system ATP-binding protein
LSVLEVVHAGPTGTTQLLPRWAPDGPTADRVEELIAALDLGRLREARWTNLSQGERAAC